MSLDKKRREGLSLFALLASAVLMLNSSNASADGLQGPLPIAENYKPHSLKQVVKKIVKEAEVLKKGRKGIKFIDMKVVIPVEHPDKNKFDNWYEALFQSGRIHSSFPIRLCNGYKKNTGKGCSTVKDATTIMRVTGLLRQAVFTYATEVCLKKNVDFPKKKVQLLKQAKEDFAGSVVFDPKRGREVKIDLKAPGHLVHIIEKHSKPVSFDKLAIVLNFKFKKTNKSDLRLSNIILSCHHNNSFLRSIVWQEYVGNQYQMQRPSWDTFKYKGSLKSVLGTNGVTK